jgi:hypothetical protein
LAEIQRSCSWKGKPIAPEKNFQREWEICVCWFSEVVWTGDCYTTPVPSENRLVSCTWSSVCFSAVFGGVLARERVSLAHIEKICMYLSIDAQFTWWTSLDLEGEILDFNPKPVTIQVLHVGVIFFLFWDRVLLCSSAALELVILLP